MSAAFQIPIAASMEKSRVPWRAETRESGGSLRAGPWSGGLQDDWRPGGQERGVASGLVERPREKRLCVILAERSGEVGVWGTDSRSGKMRSR